jgi:hypothetical protein
VPTSKLLVLKVATPEPLRVPVPSVVVPSMKVTVPVGVPVPVVGVTVAVNVTDWPNTLGFVLEVSVVEVASFTTWETTLEVLVVKLVSPA